MKIKHIGMIALAAIAAVAIAQDGFKLRRTPTVGETSVMRLTANVEVMGITAVLTAKVEEKVTKVDSNGDYTTESTQSESKLVVSDQEMPAPAGEPTVAKYAASGELLEITSGEATPDAYRVSNLSNLILPDILVKVGDKGSYETKASPKNGNVGGRSSWEVLGEETVGAWATVKLKVSFKETSGTEPAESSGTAWISKKDGSMVKFEGEYKNAPFPGAPGPINAKIKLEREK